MGRTARNDVTGAQIKTKAPNDAYKNGYDQIDWSKKLHDDKSTTKEVNEKETDQPAA